MACDNSPELIQKGGTEGGTAVGEEDRAGKDKGESCREVSSSSRGTCKEPREFQVKILLDL